MSRKKQDIPFWAKLNHPKPVTRREMLATGVIPFFAWAVGPSLGTLLSSSRAFGQTTCGGSSGPSYIPFITLNLSGGPSLASQLVVKNLSGGNISSYTKLGLGSGPNVSFNIEREFGGVEFAGTGIGGNVTGLASKFLTGMRSPLNNGIRNPALDKTAFIWSAVASADDTRMNKFDVTGYILRMGMTGSKLPNLGRTDTSTGIAQEPAGLPPPAPFVVGNVNDLANALGYAAALNTMSTPQKSALAKVIANLSGTQVRRLASTSGNHAVAQLVDCTGVKNIELVSSGGGDVNPLGLGNATSTELARIWGINVNDRTSQNAVFASMVYNGVVGNASTINLNLGGYDYHDGTRTTGDTRDLAAGVVVGKILETANFLGKPVFVYVCADGATVSTESATADSAWQSDRGIAGMQYMLAFHPSGRPAVSSNQIGGFNDGQAADGKFPTGNNPELAAQAVFSNYAAWNGRVDFLEQNRIAGDASLRAQIIKMSKA
jgi:hypothetical protein